MFTGVGCKDPLAYSEMNAGLIEPFGLPGHFQTAVLHTFRPGIARRNVTRRLAPVFPDKLRRSPDKITQVRHRLDKYLPNSAKRDPIISAFEDHFEDRA